MDPFKKQLDKLKNMAKTVTEKDTAIDKNTPEYYIQKVSSVTGWSEEKTIDEMEVARTQLGIPYEQYFKDKYYEYSRSKQERRAGKYHRDQQQKARILERIYTATGKTRDDVKEEIKQLNKFHIIRVTVGLYNRYGMYEMEIYDNLALLKKLKKERDLSEKLNRLFIKIDKGEISYDDISSEMNEYMACIRRIDTPHLYEKVKQKLLKSVPELEEEGVDKIYATVNDLIMSKQLLGFKEHEYIMYHLYRFDLKGKREFLSDKERLQIINTVNTREIYDLVNNKYSLYLKLKDGFGRDMTSILTEEDLPSFRTFVEKHPNFVLKPFNESLGRGIKLIKTTAETDIDELFKTLMDENRTFLMEELILQDERMAAFNKDTINTVRLMVYFNGEYAVPVSSFMRTGRVGSFVDNAGAGGLFADVDINTGILTTDGGNEVGELYEEHPDSHMKYKGFQIPLWDKAVELGTRSCVEIGTPCFIGWDLALTDKGQWVIVEGNGLPQFVNQVNLGYGLKKVLVDAFENNRPVNEK
ncbi:MAG: hypothetical protein IIU36_03415 [Firmicutes bacterium]|nr:hypothetical protein [Bacillota bacterium]